LLTPFDARGIDTQLDADPDLDLKDEAEALFFRVGQEALRNVLKHAEASRVCVTVARNNGFATLLIEDDGRGFDAQAPNGEGHFGLRMLADLVRESGGTLQIESAEGGGARVRVQVPA
jgi:signal transduction histidine kinase